MPKCSICGKELATSQGLAGHMYLKHGVKRRYDWDAIKLDYLGGMGINGLRKKYHISKGAAWNILHKLGVVRSPSDAARLARGGTIGWSKLTPMRGYPTRIVSIPGSDLKKLGFGPHEALEYRWVIKGNKLWMEIRKMKNKK